MRHHLYNPTFHFFKEPEHFDKHTDRSLLQYCLGATMYMPGTKDFAQAILTQKYKGLTSMVLCFEDACKEEDVPSAEHNSLHLLDIICEAIGNGNFSYDDLPLIF
ncbi:MAG: HpcH/HpaI aldolase/citrate lyase family protein, partial [Victivallales bacterium]|nr:HpcH/HpaI aldolase/citrate lyase family protein [Victivallales bacterium]